MARASAAIEAFEDDLIDTWKLLHRLPDRERGWLSSGSRSAWPSYVKDRVSDYGEGYDPVSDRYSDAPEPRRSIGPREMARIDRVFGVSGAPDCLMMEIAPDNRRLVAMVLARRSSRMPGGFRWEDVWEAFGGRAAQVTSDGLRARYERSVRRMAVKAGAIG